MVAGTASARTSARSKPLGGTETIFVVEDDLALRLLTRVTLERQGYQILEAASGVEALELWPQYCGQAALLLTELVMPGGVSGQQLARQLQQENSHLKVIFTSGYSLDFAGRELELLGSENFIQQPYAPRQLLESIRRCLDD